MEKIHTHDTDTLITSGIYALPPIPSAPEKARVLIVDDLDLNREVLSMLMDGCGYDHHEAADGVAALSEARVYNPDVILLDVMMPEMDGYMTATELRKDSRTREIPIIMVTALSDRDSRIRGLEAGATDFISKPFDMEELKCRVRNTLYLKQAGDMVKNHNRILEQKVQQRTRQLQESYGESILALMRASEYRDDETGSHVARISFYSQLLAERLGLDGKFCHLIHHASPMHDVGKIGIPDHILLKAGGLTPEEWETMKSHTTIGSEILKDYSSPYLKMGQEIALCHHERWDGTGYPQGLKGEDIPLTARIMQLCDVYDALRSKRPYKSPFDHQTSIDIIVNGDGRTSPDHFDPAILAAFRKNANDFKGIFESYSG